MSERTIEPSTYHRNRNGESVAQAFTRAKLLSYRYESERIRKIFLNSDIDFRHYYFEANLNRNESPDEPNQRYLGGAVRMGCGAIVNSLNSCSLSPQDVDLLAVCPCTGYVCPDVGTRLVAHMGFDGNIQRTSIVGLNCAGAVLTLQRATDFVRANPSRSVLVLAVGICSACYYVDRTLETVIGNAICADGTAASLLSGTTEAVSVYPRIIDFESFIDPERIEEGELQNRNGKLRIVLGESIEHLAGPRLGAATVAWRHDAERCSIAFF